MKGKATVVGSNAGDAPFNGRVTVRLFLSADNAIGDGDAEVASATKALKLKVSTGKPVKLSFKSVPSMSDGDYRLIARIEPPDGATSATVASAATTRIAAPFVKLAGTFTAGVSGAVSIGQPVKTALRLTNNGNVPASALATVQLYASPDAAFDAGTDAPLTTVPLKLKLNAGASKTYKIKFATNQPLAAGQYHLIAMIPPVLGEVANDPIVREVLFTMI